nr:uncharacterized protein LOC112543982 [Pelodiscus sinensis]|eukprot:XP_025035102.1 uncharacterized protein LOC112543982 [Pelodiscus sinensis]
MAEKVGLMSRDEEEMQNNDEKYPFQACYTLSTADCCSANDLLSSPNEERERLSISSSKDRECKKTLIGQQLITHNKAQNIAPGITGYHSTDANISLAGSSSPEEICTLKPVGISSPCPESLHCDLNKYSEELQPAVVAKKSEEASQNIASLLSCCRSWSPSAALTWNNTKEDMATCSLGQTTWMRTIQVKGIIEQRKLEEKERYQLQVAMYRRLLLLRSIRSLHKQLEQQQSRYDSLKVGKNVKIPAFVDSPQVLPDQKKNVHLWPQVLSKVLEATEVEISELEGKAYPDSDEETVKEEYLPKTLSLGSNYQQVIMNNLGGIDAVKKLWLPCCFLLEIARNQTS